VGKFWQVGNFGFIVELQQETSQYRALSYSIETGP